MNEEGGEGVCLENVEIVKKKKKKKSTEQRNQEDVG